MMDRREQNNAEPVLQAPHIPSIALLAMSRQNFSRPLPVASHVASVPPFRAFRLLLCSEFPLDLRSNGIRVHPIVVRGIVQNLRSLLGSGEQGGQFGQHIAEMLSSAQISGKQLGDGIAFFRLMPRWRARSSGCDALIIKSRMRSPFFREMTQPHLCKNSSKVEA